MRRPDHAAVGERDLLALDQLPPLRPGRLRAEAPATEHDVPEIEARYNIAPTQPVAAVGRREIAELIPRLNAGVERHYGLAKEDLAARVDHVISVPATIDMLQPILSVVPLQLLAYHISLLRGCDVDQPRNLAKSVTVE